MPKVLLEDIKSRRNFYRDNYRRLAKALFISLIIMAIFIGFIIFSIITRKQPDYYATNSAGFIIPLKAMDHPNESSEALLKPDPPEEHFEKKVPTGG